MDPVPFCPIWGRRYPKDHLISAPNLSSAWGAPQRAPVRVPKKIVSGERFRRRFCMVGLATFFEPAWSIRERQREFPWVVGRGERILRPAGGARPMPSGLRWGQVASTQALREHVDADRSAESNYSFVESSPAQTAVSRMAGARRLRALNAMGCNECNERADSPCLYVRNVTPCPTTGYG